MVRIKTILTLNIILLSLALIYYFRVEITGFVSDATSVMLKVVGTEVELTIFTFQTSFCPGEQAVISNIIKNTGKFDVSGNLTTSVFNPSGYEVLSESWNDVDLAVGETKNFESSLDFLEGNETGLYAIQSSFSYEDHASRIQTSNASRIIRFKEGIGILTGSPSYIEKAIRNGESDTETIHLWLRDACDDVTTTVSVRPDDSKWDAGDWISILPTNVFLTPYILNTTLLTISVPRDSEIGDYSSLIDITAGNQKISIPVIIHNQEDEEDEEEGNFSIVLQLPGEVCLGHGVSAMINISETNITEVVNINMTYQILDPDSVIVDNSTETIPVNTSILRTPSLIVPLSSPEGYYTFVVSLQYKSITEQMSGIFRVIDCEEPEPVSVGGGGGGGPAAKGPGLNYSMSIDVSTAIISTIAGNKETLLVTINNTGNVDLKSVRLSVEGIPSTWIKIVPNEVNIPYLKSQEYLIVLNVPKNAATGSYEIKIKAVNNKVESETKIVKLIVGKTLEELANLLLEEMEERRSIASRAILTKECLDLSEIIPIFNEGEKSRENGLNDYRSKNYQKAVDWFEHAINSYNRVIDQVDVKIQTKIDLLENEKLGIFPIIGLKKELDKLENYYLNRNYERICEPILEILRLKKLSLILWLLLLILIAVCVIILLIIRGRIKRRKRKEVMGKIRERLGEFKLETLESPENAEENL